MPSEVEKRIYNSWAFSENEDKKAEINKQIHKELISKYKVYRNDMKLNPAVDADLYDVVIGRKAGYNHAEYKVIKNKPNLNNLELLLLCDGGLLCFGGSHINGNNFRVSED